MKKKNAHYTCVFREKRTRGVLSGREGTPYVRRWKESLVLTKTLKVKDQEQFL